LQQVCPVCFLKAVRAATAVKERNVKPDDAIPGGLVARLPQLLQQAGGGIACWVLTFQVSAASGDDW
jgi:hypothetical protein